MMIERNPSKPFPPKLGLFREKEHQQVYDQKAITKHVIAEITLGKQLG
jgi:hypothetical protein